MIIVQKDLNQHFPKKRHIRVMLVWTTLDFFLLFEIWKFKYMFIPRDQTLKISSSPLKRPSTTKPLLLQISYRFSIFHFLFVSIHKYPANRVDKKKQICKWSKLFSRKWYKLKRKENIYSDSETNKMICQNVGNQEWHFKMRDYRLTSKICHIRTNVLFGEFLFLIKYISTLFSLQLTQICGARCCWTEQGSIFYYCFHFLVDLSPGQWTNNAAEMRIDCFIFSQRKDNTRHVIMLRKEIYPGEYKFIF